MFDSSDTFIYLLMIVGAAGFIYWVNVQCVRANKTDWGNFWLNRLDGLNRLFCSKYHRMGNATISLPESGGVLLISNHVSGLDPLLLIAAARRPVRFIIAKEEYHRFGLQWLFRAVGCIPIDRNGRPEAALREAIRKLNEGEVVALFPYGGIHTNEEKLPRFKRGTVLLAKLTSSKVYPVRLSGVKGEGYIVKAVPMRSRVSIEQFDPVSCDSVDNDQCVSVLDGILRGQTD